jgi:ribosome recycling factor
MLSTGRASVGHAQEHLRALCRHFRLPGLAATRNCTKRKENLSISCSKTLPHRGMLWGLPAFTPAPVDHEQRRWFAKKKETKKAGKEDEAEAADPMAESEAEIQEMDQKMVLTIQNFVAEMGKLRTGRADPRMLDNVRVKAHDAEILLAHCAQVTSTDPRSLAVSVFDPELVKSVDKAIREAGLDLNPQVLPYIYWRNVYRLVSAE